MIQLQHDFNYSMISTTAEFNYSGIQLQRFGAMRERGTREAARSFYHTCLRAPAHGRKLVCRNLFWMICMFRAECKGKDYEDIEPDFGYDRNADCRLRSTDVLCFGTFGSADVPGFGTFGSADVPVTGTDCKWR